MSYLPTFLKLDNKKILIIGGGFIAYKRLKYLLDFTKDIYVIANNFRDDMQTELQDQKICFECRNYMLGDIKNFDIIVVAIDDINLQKEIYLESKAYKCLCNFVDLVECCDFIFPSYIKNGDLTIAISTSASSPSIAKYLKKYITTLIPRNISSFLKEMKELRISLPKGKTRMKILDKKAKDYISSEFLNQSN